MNIFIWYSVLCTKENAHDDSIWGCVWGQIKPKKDNVNGENDSSRIQQSKGDVKDYIITGGVDDCVKLWAFHDKKLHLNHKLEGHSLGVVSVAVNSDGTKCASSSMDSSLFIWSVMTGEKVGSIDVGPVDIWTISFSPDDKFIISGSHSGKINMFGVESQKQEQTLDTRGKFTLSIAYVFFPGVVSLPQEFKLMFEIIFKVWTMPCVGGRLDISSTKKGYIQSPDGKYIASGAVDGIINIFDVASGKLVHTLEGHAMPIRSLCFSPDSQLLLTASDDGHMKLYDVQHANVVGTLSGHASWVLGVAFSPDNAKFVSSSSDHSVKIWELATRSCVHTFTEHHDQVWGVKYNADGNKIVSVSDDKSIIIYDCPT